MFDKWSSIYNIIVTIASLTIYLKLFDYYLALVYPVNQFGVHICLVLPLTHVMVLEILVHQLQ